MFIILAQIILFSSVVMARDNSFYDTDINYWPEKSEKKTEEVKKPSQKIENFKEQKFDWKKVSDPNNDEFYRQGEYMPPAALVEAMKNPSDANLKRYFDLKEKRDRKLKEFIKRSKKFRERNLEKIMKQIDRPKINKHSFYNARALRLKYRIRMYYDSRCPHCQKMYHNLIKLQNDGFNVDAVQIDQAPISFTKIKSRRLRIGEGELVKLYKGGTPYTLILNKENKKIQALRGYVDLSKFRNILN